MKRVWWIHKKDKIIFTDFKLFSLFEDMILAFAIMKCFSTLLTFITPVVYHQNLKLIKLCLKEFDEFTKRQNIFYRFQIIFTFWGYDTFIFYNEMFPNTFNIYNTSSISSKFKINKTLFDLFEIDYTLFNYCSVQSYMITIYC